MRSRHGSSDQRLLMGTRDTDARLHGEEHTVFVIFADHLVVNRTLDPGVLHRSFNDLRGGLPHRPSKYLIC